MYRYVALIRKVKGTGEKMNFKWYTTDDFLHLEAINVFGKEQSVNPCESDIKNYHCLCRSRYEYNGNERVIMQITADDYYKLYINGFYVAEGPAPSYHTARFFNELDITKYLDTGDNLIALHLYYQGLINRVWQSGDNRFGVACLMNGENLSWKYKKLDAFSGHELGYHTAFSENFDSRFYDENWKTLGFDDAHWNEMKEKKHDYTFCKQTTKQLSVYEIKPKKINGNVYDFGSEIVGGLKIKVRGKSDRQIVIRCGEELNDDGTVRYNLRANCKYEETWLISDGDSIYENYDYKAFRYAEILNGEAEILSLEAVVRHYPFDEEYCVFQSDEKYLAEIFNICKNAVKWGSQEGFLDCPSREKGQYLGDSLIIAHSHLILTGDNSLLRKAIDDFAQTSAICKGLMAVSSSSFMQEIADYSLLFGELLVLEYNFSKDRAFLEKYYPIAKNVLLYFKEYENGNGLISAVKDKWNLVDWPENLRDGYDFPLTNPINNDEPHNVINAFYLGAVKTLNEIEKLLDYNISFELEKLKQAFNEEFFDGTLYRDSKISVHNSLHSNVLPLYFDLALEENKEKICDYIFEKGFSCGVYMSYFVLKSLTKNGRYEEAYKLIINETEQGWVNMIREDANCCFEAWGKEQKWNTSLCHPWASAPIIVLVEDILPHNENIGKIIINEH